MIDAAARAAAWLLSERGEALSAAITALPPDDPAPGIEVDLGPLETRLRVVGEAREFVFAADEIGALGHGLTLLAARGVEEAANLRERLPRHDAPARDAVSAGGEEATLRLSPAAGAWLVARGQGKPERGGSVLLGVERASPEALLPWMLRLGPHARVVEPRTMRVALAEMAVRLAEEARRPPPDPRKVQM